MHKHTHTEQATRASEREGARRAKKETCISFSYCFHFVRYLRFEKTSGIKQIATIEWQDTINTSINAEVFLSNGLPISWTDVTIVFTSKPGKSDIIQVHQYVQPSEHSVKVRPKIGQRQPAKQIIDPIVRVFGVEISKIGLLRLSGVAEWCGVWVRVHVRAGK